MASWSEIEPKYKIVILSLACVLIAAGVWYAMVRPMEQINRDDLAALQAKKTEIAQLMPFQARITQLNKEIETYRQQIEQQKQIVPEDKQVDGFIRMIQAQAQSSGIELRRFTAMPVVTRDFYSELPFEIEIDGPYFGVVRFFEQIGKMERLVSVSNLAMANVKNPSSSESKEELQIRAGRECGGDLHRFRIFQPEGSTAATTTGESAIGEAERVKGSYGLESCKCDFVIGRHRMGAGPGRCPAGCSAAEPVLESASRGGEPNRAGHA